MTLAEYKTVLAATAGVSGAITDAELEKVVLMSWAAVAGQAAWWFLEQDTPKPISVVSGTDTYLVDQEDVGFLLVITDDSDKPVYTYKDHFDWHRLRNNMSDEYTEGTPAYFRVRGKSNQKVRVQLLPTPNANATRYVHYCEKGKLGNIALLPDRWSEAVIHKGMTLLAKPQQVNANYWRAVKSDHFALYNATMENMLAEEQHGPVHHYRPDIDYDGLTEDRIEEVNDA